MWERCQSALEQVFTSAWFQSSVILLWLSDTCPLIVHVFLPSPVQTKSHGTFSLLPLPRLLSSYKMHVSKLTIQFEDVIEICVNLQAEYRRKHTWYSLIIMIIQQCVKRMLICFARDRVCAISIPSQPPNAVSWTQEACVQRCLVQRRFGNVRPPSSRVYNKTCMILSNHYHNPKILEKNADLLCKRSRFVISIAYHFHSGWDVYCIYRSRVSYVWLIYQCGLYVDKIKI